VVALFLFIMKAIQVHDAGGPEVLLLEDVPDLQPGADEVVVRVRAAGVNPVDTYIRSGHYPVTKPYPYTPGMDAAGEVLAVGAKVKKWKVGQRVYTAGSLSGTYAEQTLCKQSDVHELPQRISFAQGAGLNVPYATAWCALFERAAAQPNDVVLVHGASGGVGIAAVQLALAAGLTVIGTAGSERGMKLVEEQGAQYVLNHREPGYLSDILGATCGRGMDIILEMNAHLNLGHDLGLLARKGRLVVIGSRGEININPRDLMSRNASIHGLTLLNSTPDDIQKYHAAIVAGLKSGALNPVVDQEIPLSEAPRAHQAVIEGNSHGKIVLVP
jgi:NADPH2:quinone reductase